MRVSKLACLVGSFLAGVAGFSAAACSSSSTPTPTVDSGSPAGDTGSSATDTGSSTTDTGSAPPPSDGGTESSCGNTPSLHPSTAGEGLYCPFGAAPDGGSLTLYCGADGGADNLCCVSGEVGSSYPPSFCAKGSCTFTATTGITQIACEDPATDCPSGNVCCGAATGGKVISLDPGCTYDKLSDWAYTRCATSCGTNEAGAVEFELCATNAECSGGKTCTPFKAKGLDLGYCK